MKHLLAVLVFLGLFMPVQATNKHKAQVKDSLLRIYLASPPDTTRLKALYDIALLEPQSSPSLLHYMDKLQEEAVAQKNLPYQSLAIYYHIMYYYNRLDRKNATQWVQALEELAKEHNYYTHYCMGKKMLIELYTVDRKIELAINEALNMYKEAKKINDRNGMREAYLCLLTSYFETMRYKEAIDALDKAFELIKPEDPPLERITIYSKAVLAYSITHNNDKMLVSLQQMEEATNEFIASKENISQNTYPDLFLFIETHYTLYHTRCRQPAEARKHLQKAESYLEASSFLPYRVKHFAACAEYYRLTKSYEKALEYWDSTIRLAKSYSPKDVISFSTQKADLLVTMGKAEEALHLYKEIIINKDSLYTSLTTSQMEEIQSLHNMDKLILQKEQRRNTYHHICLLITAIIIIALSIFNIQIYRSRKRLQKDEEEMKRLTAIAEEANEVKSLFLANMSYNIRIPLNNVVGFSQLMTENVELSEMERKEYSSIIQSNSTELMQLVNDILDLSRLEANMMKFQLQDCNVQEWCNELSYMAQMRSEEGINLQLQAEVGNAVIHTDVNRLTQVVSSMLFYSTACKEPRKVKMSATYHPEKGEVSFMIENSPLADPLLASQRIAIRQKINQLFFEHFKGTYRMENREEGGTILFFTYPTLTT